MTAIRKLQEAYDALVPDDHGAMAMDLIRHIAGLYSGKAIKGDFTQIYITGNEIWMAQQVLAQHAQLTAERNALQSIMEWTAAENIPADHKLCLIRNAAISGLGLDRPGIPANCPQCGGSGEVDSGGTYPWGEPALIPCGCQSETENPRDKS
ncbi:hypothetical protein [Pseudomonas pseudonitroreducens]|uniref:hypothetical protein n=1 Tax=Pseudomonas pseudonitroreducens TaxID=2892326 RepID=UPI001F1E3B14|nr:hypothetical protein [Pseudomonas pseudonitroreducens]